MIKFIKLEDACFVRRGTTITKKQTKKRAMLGGKGFPLSNRICVGTENDNDNSIGIVMTITITLGVVIPVGNVITQFCNYI